MSGPGLTIPELVDFLDPPVTRAQVEGMIEAIRLRPSGRRLTGKRGRPVNLYDPKVLLAVHADLVKHQQQVT